MARAAEQVAVSAGKLNANVEIATNETAKKLGEALQETFASVVAGAVNEHADKIGERLSEQTERRLGVAKETLAGLTVLKGEVRRLTSDMATDVEAKGVDRDLKTLSGLERHSIFHGM